MTHIKNRLGERYGRLLVVKFAGRDEKGNILWKCKCDCGNYKIATSNNLSSGKTNSCGCLLNEFLHKSGNQYGLYKDREDAIMKVQYSHLKRRHKIFSGDILSYDEFKKKIKQPCYYCGLEYSKELKDRRNETISDGLLSETIVKCNGLDRVDSNIGYTNENTVPCCTHCNTAKSTMSKEEFLEWVSRVYKHNF